MVAAQPMEWKTLHHLDLRHADPGPKQLQPHAAAFHPNQAIVAVANGNLIIEFDVLTGSKISSLDIGAPVVRMSYSPTSSHTVIAVLEDCTIRSCDFDNEQTCVLHSPEKRSEQVSDDAEVHIALTPLQPVVFFGFHKRMSVTVVGTVEGGRAPTKIKTDLKKPIINLTCHPRFPLLYVAYADGLIRAYNIHTYAVHYTLQLESTIKLVGAGAFAFHPTLEWVFVGDRGGTLLAWDVSTDRPNLIGITQVGSHPIVSVAWHSMLRLLITLSRDGSLQVWRTRVIVDPTKQPMPAKFFEPSGIPQIDITGILFQKEGEGVYPLPRIKSFAVHPKLNLATILFADPSTGDSMKNRASFTREGRKQLFAVLQNARGLTAADLKEKLLSLGSSGILADHQLQTQLQEQHFRGQSQLSMTDIARKAFLHSHFMEGHSKSGPISRLPLITIVDSDYHLKDSPVCQPFHLDLNFFNRENRVLHYPIRAFYMEGTNLMAYNLCSGADNIYKKLYPTLPVNSEYCPKRIIYSSKQHLFLIVVGVTSNSHEVVVYKEQTDLQTVNTKGSVVEGRDAAFIGPSESQYAILENDKTGLALYHLPQPISPTKALTGSNGALDPEAFSEKASVPETGALLFAFDSEVDRIFSSPLESTLMYASDGDHIGLAKLIQGYRVLTSFNQNSAKNENKKALKLRANEIVLQVRWQETLRGYVAGVLTTGRVMIVTADLVILSSSSSSHDTGFPSFRSLLWLGPALLFSTTTTIAVLGWDSIIRAVLSISMPNSVLLGVLNDRILLACPTDINPRQKKGVEIRSCLVGLLEPLLIGFATMQQHFEQKIDLSETLYQLTSRFDSLRISSRSLDILSKGSPVCGDLAVALSQAGPQFTQVQRCIYAVKALRFSTALSVLKDEFLRSRDYPHCHPTSHLFYRFQQLGFACIKHAQFDSAKETFESISDFQSMLDLFICHLNPSAMRRLAQKLEDAGTDSELRRYCERILRVRSSGWTEGIFANFAAESMMPKGEEWGGGNWEIKTPSNVKATPQWELAAEVMPYMRTSDGAIPAMIADHIGVYLGVMKGRGNVAEVREDSLVKKIVAMNAEPKADGPSTALVKFPSGKSKLPTQGEKEAGSLNSLEAIIRSTAGDEQHKAEEEFKKSLYGHDGNSSEEEEGPSKTKKIHIRIKPAAPATVDVNKIKEATKTFKLGDGLGPPLSRTRSSSGGFQELALALTQTTPATGAANNAVPVIDLPGGPPVSAPSAEPTPKFMGMGVSAGPIPEDFFQNTISSIQIAASMRPPGTVLVQGTPQPTPASNIPPSSQATTVPIGLPDGGVPPQAQAEQATISLESIGLPDGGVPPQSVSPQPPQPPAVTTTNMSPSQPLDLAVLEGISIGVNGTKAAGRPTPPTSVRPGQVPRGADASVCFKTALAHLEQNQLPDALSCLDEAFLALAKDQSQGADVKAQATICAQYKTAVPLLQEIGRLQKVQGQNAISAKDEMARLSRHLASLPLLAKHRINCIRTAIKRNMEVQNYAYSKSMLDLLLSKAPVNKQDELRSLIEICLQRGLSNKSIDPLEDPSQFCAVTLSRLSTIGHDACDLCGSKFSALTAPGCIICGMGSIKRSDAQAGPVSTPFG